MRVLSAAQPLADSGIVDSDHPWPGPPSFREQDRLLFHGREKEADDLRNAVLRQSSRLTVLYGRSGFGKTSLLQAGLFPRLRQLEILPVYLRLDFAGERSLLSQTTDAVFAAARNPDHGPIEAPAVKPQETLWEWLHRTDANFWTAANRLVTPLLVFDQFEEFFTRGTMPIADRKAFLAELADLVEGRPPLEVETRVGDNPDLAAAFTPERHNYKVLICLRQDCLADLEGMRWLMPSLGANRLPLVHMNGNAALQAVTQAGGRLIDPEVAEDVVRFVAASVPGPGGAAGQTAMPEPLDELQVDPTLLSVLCRELNNERLAASEPKITAALVRRSGKKILVHFYERCLQGFGPEVRSFVEDHLVDESGRRTFISLDEATKKPGITLGILVILEERRLLRIEERDRRQLIELTHDVLTDAIRESRENRREREARLRAEASEREARRQLKRSRRIALAMGSLLVSVLILAACVIWLEKASHRAQGRYNRALLDYADTLLGRGKINEALACYARAMRYPETSLPARIRAFDAILHHSSVVPIATIPHLTAINCLELSPNGRYLATCSNRSARLWDARTGRPIGQEMRHDGRVNSARFSADSNLLVTASSDSTARIWSVPSGQGDTLQPPLRLAEEVISASFSPNAELFVTETNHKFQVWRRSTPPELRGSFDKPRSDRDNAGYARQFNSTEAHGLPAQGKPSSLQPPSPADQRLLRASASFLPFQDLWVEAAGAQPSKQLPSDAGPFTGGRYSLSGRWLAAIGTSGRPALWNMEVPGRPTLLNHARVVQLLFSANERWLMTTSSDGGAILWEVATGKQIGNLLPLGPGVLAVSIDDEGAQALTTSSDKTIQVWDMRSGQLLLDLGRQERFTVAAPQAGRSWLAAALSGNGTATIMEVRIGRPIAEELRGNSQVVAADFSGDGRKVILRFSDGVRIWQVGGPPSPIVSAGNSATPSRILSTGFLSDGSATATIFEAGRNKPTVRVVKLEDGRTLHTEDVTNPYVAAALDLRSAKPALQELELKSAGHNADGPLAPALTRNGEWIVTSSAAGAKLWSWRASLPIAEIDSAGTQSAEASEDGKRLLTVTNTQAGGNEAQLWDTRTGRRLGLAIPLMRMPAEPIQIDPLGLHILVNFPSESQLWDVEAGRKLCSLDAGTSTAFAASFSPDGGRFVAPALGAGPQIRDALDCRVLGDPLPEEKQVRFVSFSPDGSRLLTATEDGVVHVWDVPIGSIEDGESLALLAEAIGGLTINEEGFMAPVTDPSALVATLRRRSATSPSNGTVMDLVIRRYLAGSAHHRLAANHDLPPPSPATDPAKR